MLFIVQYNYFFNIKLLIALLLMQNIYIKTRLQSSGVNSVINQSNVPFHLEIVSPPAQPQ